MECMIKLTFSGRGIAVSCCCYRLGYEFTPTLHMSIERFDLVTKQYSVNVQSMIVIAERIIARFLCNFK